MCPVVIGITVIALLAFCFGVSSFIKDIKNIDKDGIE